MKNSDYIPMLHDFLELLFGADGVFLPILFITISIVTAISFVGVIVITIKDHRREK